MRVYAFVASLVLMSCAPSGSDRVAELPFAISNNAVAYHADTKTVFSFAGLKAGKTHHDVTADAWKCQAICESIKPLPDGIGRLAATAQTIGDTVYIFGGYSVGADESEISTPEVWAYDINAENYTRKTDMPVPVDDTVSLTYLDRYIYLVSGWHKDDNVVNVQLYDTRNDTWEPASDWPGTPVFGHAGGIVENVIVVCDGVIVKQPVPPEIRRSFTDISACWRGDIDVNDPTQIMWRRLPQLPGKGHYRMAATGWAEKNMIVFAGGSDNPYNIDGIGYNEVPSEPSAHVWGYDIDRDTYTVFKDKPVPTMDHRALIHLGDKEFITLGGMGEDQTVLNRIHVFKVKK